MYRVLAATALMAVAASGCASTASSASASRGVPGSAVEPLTTSALPMSSSLSSVATAPNSSTDAVDSAAPTLTVGASIAPTPPVPTTAPGCTSARSVVAAPASHFPQLPAGTSTQLATEPMITVASGKVPATLQAKDLVAGAGATITAGDSVTVNWIGVNYLNCKEFGSTWANNAEMTLTLSQVIPGFANGLTGTADIPPIKVGGRREIIVPPSDGYGTGGSYPGITGNEELIFVVDVLQATPAPQ
jgi:peptidylprolyl isomerase